MVIELDSCNGVNGFTENQIREMQAFLQGAVYCWCKNRKNEWFVARDLLGGDNKDWQGTPLIDLYEYYLGGNHNNDKYAIAEAGKAAGRLLAGVLIKDKRTFKTREGYTREYLWTGR